MDSGAFSEISLHGGYRHTVKQYARLVQKWQRDPDLKAVVSQDYMCEESILRKTGLTVLNHQDMTISRYEQLRGEGLNVYIMPVIQGYAPEEYARHARRYKEMLTKGDWVGVGSVCKRNTDPRAVERVLLAVRAERPDLRLHGFGLKSTALAYPGVLRHLWTADSMAWSFNARFSGRNQHGVEEATEFWERISKLVDKAKGK